jgi:hypothetical protein
MSPKLLRPVAFFLAVGIVVMLAAITGSTFAHELQHAAHHNARMHATGICAWMCATAASVTTPVFTPLVSPVRQELVPVRDSQAVSVIPAQRLRARAPPILL